MKATITLRRTAKSYNRTYSDIGIADENGRTLFAAHTTELMHDSDLAPGQRLGKRCLPQGEYSCTVAEGESALCALRIAGKPGWRIEPRADRAAKPRLATVLQADGDRRTQAEFLAQWNDTMMLLYTADHIALVVDDGELR